SRATWGPSSDRRPRCFPGRDVPGSGRWRRAAATGRRPIPRNVRPLRSEEHTSELQSLTNLVCRLLLEKKKPTISPKNAAQGAASTPPAYAQAMMVHPLTYLNPTSSHPPHVKPVTYNRATALSYAAADS